MLLGVLRLGVLRLGARTATTALVTRRLYSSSSAADGLHHVRNIGIIAHIDAGKTTTTERMLHYAGFTRTIGDVDSGDTVMDYLAAERARGITIQSAAITFGWRDHQVHLIDTPGHVDFTVEVERAVRVLDGAVTIVDAVAGVQAQTRTVWAQAARYGIPQVVFVNKMDRDGAEWQRCIEDVRRRLDVRPLVLVVPESAAGDGRGQGTWGRLEGAKLERWLDAVTMERVTYDLAADPSGAIVRREALLPDDPAYERAAGARERLVEALGEVDERIVDVFMGEGVDGQHVRVPSAEVRAAVRRATVGALACPVLLGASFRNVGVQALMDAVVDYLPSPADRPAPTALVAAGKTDRQVTVAPDANDKLVAFAFKVIVDQQRGPMVFVRVYAGSLDARMALVNTTQGAKERAQRVLQMYGDTAEEIPFIPCGHIGVVLGLKATRTGDTLVHAKHPLLSSSGAGGKAGKKGESGGLQLHGIAVPPPVFFCAVEADSPQDERPLAEALASLTLEDPSLHVSADAETGQTLVSGMGELHLDVVRDRLLNDMRVNASFGAMRVAYRETPGQVARAAFEYVRETAGRMAHAEVELEVAPLDPEDEEGCDVKGERDAADGNVVEVADAVVDSAAANGGTLQGEVLREVRAAAAGGVHGALARGVLLGFPVAHARVRILRLGHISDELSSPAAFRACAAQALQQALRASSPQLLEPLARAAVRCPAGALGAVLADLNGARRGRVLALDEDAADAEVKVVLAEVPLSAMVGYASVLRSLSAGQASFAMQVVGFGAMAQHEQQKVLSRAHVV